MKESYGIENPRGHAKKYSVFKLSNLRELDNPVKKTDYGIQSKKYTTLKKLKEAEYLPDL